MTKNGRNDLISVSFGIGLTTVFTEENMHAENYITGSLELHLFLKAGFTPVTPELSARAEFYKNEFEKLLSTAVSLGKGIVSKSALDSGEFVTEFTLAAERQTEKFTGIRIDSGITERELRMKGGVMIGRYPDYCRIKSLNSKALGLLDGLISLKEEILSKVLSCRIFTMNYPLLIEHILREAKLYRKYLRLLEDEGTIDAQSMKETECFWNRIMMEHAMFIRGLLDPAESELIKSAEMFTEDYAVLLQSCRNAQNRALTEESMAETKKFRDFKAAGTKGIEDCRIRSVILPLLADHVLREANHFIRILEDP